MTGGQRVFVGLVCGAAAGLALARWAPGSVDAVAAVARPVGTLWLHALQMTVVPLVVSLIVVGVSQAADVAAGGRIARRALAWILVLSVAASAFAAVADAVMAQHFAQRFVLQFHIRFQYVAKTRVKGIFTHRANAIENVELAAGHGP